MPIPSSGALSLNDIQTEFGGSNPIAISEYYAGAGLVPSGTTGTNGAVPSSGQISISQFYGTQAVVLFWSTSYSVTNTFGGRTITRPYISGNSLIWTTAGNSGGRYIHSINASTGATNYSRLVTNNPPANSNFNGTQDSLFVDSSGNVTLCRRIDYSGGTAAGQIIQLNSAGSVVFAKLTSTGLTPSWRALTGDNSGNIYAVGAAGSGGVWTGIRFIKMDSSGNITWARSFANSTYAATMDGLFISRYDPNGFIIGMGTGFTGGARAILAKYDTNGNYISGAIINSTSGQQIYGYDMACASNGNIYVALQNTSTGTVIMKLNSSFVMQWAVSISNASGAWTIELDANENVYVYSGVSSGGNIAMVSVLNSSGSLLSSYGMTATTGDSYIEVGLSATGLALQSTSALFVIASLVENGATVNGAILKVPPTTVSSGYYPTSSSTQGIFWGSSVSAGSVSNVASNYSIITPSATLTTPTITNSDFSVTSVTSASPTLVNNSYTGTATRGSVAFTFPGTYTWIPPSGVTSVSAVAIGGGGSGYTYGGSGGGGLGYANNFAVTPGLSYTVTVGTGGTGTTCQYQLQRGGTSSVQRGATFVSACGGGGYGRHTCPGFGSPNGYQGGYGGLNTNYGGGGGAGGYTGSGGQGGAQGGSGSAGSGGAGGGGGGAPYQQGNCQASSGAGGGTGIIGQGASGAGGSVGSVGGGGSGATRGSFGGGGSAGGYYYCSCPCFGGQFIVPGSNGASGAVRIVWPGNTRQFPTTSVGAP